MTALERFVPAMRGRLAYEHVHRYAAVLDLAAGRKILDIASGEGYGSALLATKAAEVVGVDVDKAATAKASQIYAARRNLTFIDADAGSLPFGPAEFDLVVSFETIEHIEHQEQMIEEIARVLKPGGILVISTPNKPVYSGEGRKPNPFHLKELDADEFASLLKAHFAHVEIQGQRFYIGSVLAPFGETGEAHQRTEYAALRRLPGNDVDVARGTVPAAEPEYLIALCSREKLPRRKHPSSIYVDPADDLWLEQEKVLRWASGLHDEDEVLRAHVRKIDRELEDTIGQREAERRRAELLSQQLERSRQLVALMEADAQSMMTMLATATERGKKSAELASGFDAVLEEARESAAKAVNALEEKIRAAVEREQTLAAELTERNRQIEAEMARGVELGAVLSQEKADRERVAAELLEERLRSAQEVARRDEQLAGLTARAAELDTALSSERAERERQTSELSEEKHRLAQQIADRSEQMQVVAVRAAQLDTALSSERAERERAVSELSGEKLRLAREVSRLEEQIRGVTARMGELDAALSDERVRREVMLTELSQERLLLSQDIARRDARLLTAAERVTDLEAALTAERTARERLIADLAQEKERSATAHKLAEALAEKQREMAAAVVAAPVAPAAALVQANGSWKGEAAHQGPETGDVGHLAGDPKRPWLPEEVSQFWITQGLRDHLIEQHGDDAVGPVEYLMSLVSHFDTTKADIVSSSLGKDLIARIAKASAKVGRTEAPDVTILIPVYNGLVYTLTAILSILQTPTRFSYEILIGDNCSTDATEPVLSAFGGCIRYMRHDQNRGFLGNCNTAAKEARGRYLVLLNNDVVTLPGWLDELIGTFGIARDVGLAGSKLINGDGSLQEAGGIFWSDGSAWNFGRNQNPRMPQFNYLKDVDYISGAAIAFPLALWRQLDGFDRIYSPAYCEDADIAFRVRAAGLRCVYQPHSEIIHHEGRTHGTDTAVGIKAHQVLNQQKLVSRWRHVLTRDHFPNGENVFVARDRSRNKPHIVFIDHYVPQWDRDAGSRTMMHFMRLFQSHGFHVMLWPDNLHYDKPYVRKLQEMGIEVVYSASFLDRFESWLKDADGWLDYVFSSRPDITQRYLPIIRSASKVPVLYYGHDLHWKRLENQYLVEKSDAVRKAMETARTLEETIAKQVDCVLYPSREECEIVRETTDKPVVEIPAWRFDDAELARARERITRGDNENPYRLLFVGGFRHPPNGDAVLWFVNEVMPLILQEDDRFELHVAGSETPESVRNLASPSVKILGQLSDAALAEIYDTCGFSVAPLRFGGGVKGKVVEALAKGISLVTTSVGVQGISDGERYAFVADTSEAFAAAVLQAARDRALAAEKSMNGLGFVQSRYSDAAIIAALKGSVPELSTVRTVHEGSPLQPQMSA